MHKVLGHNVPHVIDWRVNTKASLGCLCPNVDSLIPTPRPVLFHTCLGPIRPHVQFPGQINAWPIGGRDIGCRPVHMPHYIYTIKFFKIKTKKEKN